MIKSAFLSQNEWTPEDIESLKYLVLYDWFGEADQEFRAPGCLRLAFHDCVGGCDGCINFGNAANGGLQEAYEPFNVLYGETFPFNGKTMSRADFINLAGIVAVEYSIDFNNANCQDPDCQMPLVRRIKSSR